MPELQNWNKYLVSQRHQLGCIPAGFEWMIRYAAIEYVELEKFQEDFNLQARGEGENNFESIVKAVSEQYPYIRFQYKIFATGEEKTEFIRYTNKREIPCLISLTLKQEGGLWHMMPVYYIDDGVIRVIHHVNPNEIAYLIQFPLREIIYRHNNWPGGKDVAWIDN